MSENTQRDPVDVLAEEFVARYRNGQRPTVQEYADQHPELAERIRRIFPTLVLMEDLAPRDDDSQEMLPATSRTIEHAPAELGDYHIIREIGRGGMGIVYEAEQKSLGRRIALKVLPKQMLLDPKHKNRFTREAKVAANLHHTNIVPVFGVGECEGMHYYAMQYIHGLGLDEVLVELRQMRKENNSGAGSGRPAVGEVKFHRHSVRREFSAGAVAQSLITGHFAKSSLLDPENSGDDDGWPPSAQTRELQEPSSSETPASATRDTATGRLSDTFSASDSVALPGQSSDGTKTKPSRHAYWQSVARIGVQVAEALQYAHDQGTLHRDVKPSNLLLDARGTVWVTDFGLAKSQEHENVTRTGDIVGTLRYMAPEMFSGQADARTDVYALGLTLYELLALEPAFGEPDQRKLIDQAARGTPQRLRKLAPHVPRDLETIVHKAIDRDPSHRYQAAKELAADLQRYLGDEPIRARWISPGTRFARWCRRNPALATLTCTAVLLLIAATALLLQVSQDRARAAGKVELILEDVKRLESEQRWPEALLAARRAEAVVEAGVASVQARRRVQAALADMTFVQRLDEARQRKATWDVTRFDHAGSAEAYALAFRDNGMDLRDLSIAEAVAGLKSHPQLVLPLTLALEDWAGSCIQIRDRSLAEKLMTLADAIDTNPWRSRVRGALRDKRPRSERDALLKELAASAPVLNLPPSCYWQLASELRLRGYVAEGTDLLQRAQSAHPGDFWINFDLACFCNVDPRPEVADQAVAYYRVALAIRPQDAAVLNGLGLALRTAGRLDEAIDCHRRATAIDPSNAAALNNLGLDLMDQDHLDEAIQYYRQAIVLAPACALIHCNLGEALRRQDRLDDAIKSLQTALKIDSKYADAHNHLGLVLAQRQQWDQAIASYRQAIAFQPDYATAHVNIGVACAEKGDWTDAIGWYQKAIALDRRLVPAHYDLGNALMKLERLDEAMECWREAIRIDPTYALAYDNLGVALAIRGNLDDAIDCWTKSLRFNPNNLKTRQDLVRALLQQAHTQSDSGGAEQACDVARRILVLTDETSDIQLQQMRREAERFMPEQAQQLMQSSVHVELNNAVDRND